MTWNGSIQFLKHINPLLPNKKAVFIIQINKESYQTSKMELFMKVVDS